MKVTRITSGKYESNTETAQRGSTLVTEATRRKRMLRRLMTCRDAWTGSVASGPSYFSQRYRLVGQPRCVVSSDKKT